MNCLQKSIMFTLFCPSAGPTGGAGVAPPAAVLIKKAAGIEHASGNPKKDKVASITLAQAEEIAKTKMPDLNAASLEAATDMIKGTARSMGVTVVE